MSDSNYNYIYNKLVDDKNDIFGIIAYSVYKRQKIEYLDKFKAEHGRDATKEELEHFKEISNSETQLEFYNTQAAHLANAFLSEVLSDRIEELDKSFHEHLNTQLLKSKNGFSYGVYQSIVGSVFFVLLVGVIVFFSWSLNQGLENAVESAFGITITHNEKQ